MVGKVLITAKSVASSASALKILDDAGCAVEVKNSPTPFDEDWAAEQVCDVDALVFAMEPVTSRLIDAAPRLRIIARPGVGYDTVDVAACTRRRIAVTIASGTNDQSVADFAMGLLLIVTRNFIAAAYSVQQHRWDRFVGTEVCGKTITVIGLGRIGKGMATRARGFDMRVLAVNRSRDEGFAARHGIEYVDLETGLRCADFASLHVPLTTETENLMDLRRIGLMKSAAYLINTARGGLVDENALADAVRSKQLGGAAVDVLRDQGPNSASPLINVPGIIVTPHMASFAREAMERVAISVAQSVVAGLSGARPVDVINPQIYGP